MRYDTMSWTGVVFMLLLVADGLLEKTNCTRDKPYGGYSTQYIYMKRISPTFPGANPNDHHNFNRNPKTTHHFFV